MLTIGGLTRAEIKRTTVNSMHLTILTTLNDGLTLMPKKANAKENLNTPLLDGLFEAHVAYELAQLNEANFGQFVDREIKSLIEQANSSKLADWISAQTIKDLIQDHVILSAIPGSIADIAGQLSDKVFTSSFHKKTKLKQIISRAQFEEFVDKALELKEQRNNGLDKLIDLPIYTDLISGILFQSIIHYIYDNNLISKNIPGVSSLLKASKNFISKAAPNLGSGIEDSVRSYISNSLELIIIESKAFLTESVTDADMKASAMELWERIEDKPLAEFQRGMSSLDLSEFIALGYNFWLSFRKSSYFKSCYETSVDHFFKLYAQYTIEEILEEFQVTPEKMSNEIYRFAPFLIRGLTSSGYLEQAIRRHLKGFYQSTAAADCLNQT